MIQISGLIFCSSCSIGGGHINVERLICHNIDASCILRSNVWTSFKDFETRLVGNTLNNSQGKRTSVLNKYWQTVYWIRSATAWRFRRRNSLICAKVRKSLWLFLSLLLNNWVSSILWKWCAAKYNCIYLEFRVIICHHETRSRRNAFLLFSMPLENVENRHSLVCELMTLSAYLFVITSHKENMNYIV